MPSINDIFGSGNYLKSEDLKQNGPFKGFVTAVKPTTFEKDGKIDPKLDVSIKNAAGEEKTVSCNRTNARVIAMFYGPDYTQWVGKPMIFYFDPTVSFGGKLVGGIKAKVPASAARTAPAPAPAPAPEPAEGDPFGDVDDDLL